MNFNERLEAFYSGKKVMVDSCPKCNRLSIHYNKQVKTFRCYKCNSRFKKPRKKNWVPPTFKQAKGKAPASMPDNISIKNMILDCEDKTTQALMSVLYLTGARISEIVKSLTVNQIRYETMKGVRMWRFERLIVLKRREPVSRTVIVSPSDEDLMDIVVSYCKGMDRRQVVFDFSRKTAWYRIKKFDKKIYPHWFRHACATTKTIDENFDAQYLVKFMGWANLNQAQRYSHLNVSDIKRKMLANYKERKENY